LAIISVGKNSFGHPTKEVLNKLINLSIKSMRTDEEGEIEIISDGEKWGVK
jgi:competence protein ComEC